MNDKIRRRVLKKHYCSQLVIKNKLIHLTRIRRLGQTRVQMSDAREIGREPCRALEARASRDLRSRRRQPISRRPASRARAPSAPASRAPRDSDRSKTMSTSRPRATTNLRRAVQRGQRAAGRPRLVAGERAPAQRGGAPAAVLARGVRREEHGGDQRRAQERRVRGASAMHRAANAKGSSTLDASARRSARTARRAPAPRSRTARRRRGRTRRRRRGTSARHSRPSRRASARPPPRRRSARRMSRSMSRPRRRTRRAQTVRGFGEDRVGIDAQLDASAPPRPRGARRRRRRDARASARASRAALAGADDAHVPLRSRSTSAFPVSNARDAAAGA